MPAPNSMDNSPTHTPSETSAADASIKKKKNSRRKHRNSHLGCGTCKKRRIKCDENLPSCLNCLKGKLHCAYLHLDVPARNALRMAQYNQNLRQDRLDGQFDDDQQAQVQQQQQQQQQQQRQQLMLAVPLAHHPHSVQQLGPGPPLQQPLQQPMQQPLQPMLQTVSTLSGPETIKIYAQGAGQAYAMPYPMVGANMNMQGQPQAHMVQSPYGPLVQLQPVGMAHPSFAQSQMAMPQMMAYPGQPGMMMPRPEQSMDRQQPPPQAVMNQPMMTQPPQILSQPMLQPMQSQPPPSLQPSLQPSASSSVTFANLVPAQQISQVPQVLLATQPLQFTEPKPDVDQLRASTPGSNNSVPASSMLKSPYSLPSIKANGATSDGSSAGNGGPSSTNTNSPALPPIKTEQPDPTTGSASPEHDDSEGAFDGTREVKLPPIKALQVENDFSVGVPKISKLLS